ncbi:hypothetical protein ACAG26_19460 [Mycobacterium sp. pUA109]|uniref:hypothetical protein n=1 Tax=Mycobacterium sp. pUA109 TaxID=3238982 RepID=UPI00351BBA59
MTADDPMTVRCPTIDYALSGEGRATATEWSGGGNTRGPAKLEVVFTPVPR